MPGVLQRRLPGNKYQFTLRSVGARIAADVLSVAEADTTPRSDKERDGAWRTVDAWRI